MKKIFFVSATIIFYSISIGQTWVQKTQFPGSGRWTALGFSIGSKGYVCGGYDGSAALDDMWEWDQTSNTWAQKANMPSARFAHSGFVISGKIYVGIGQQNSSGSQYNDWWEYDPSSNLWSQKINFSSGYRGYTEFFSIGSKGYICTGIQNSPLAYQNDLWEYDPVANGWTQKANFPGSVRGEGISFVVNNIAYFGMGKYGASSYNDIWKWDPATNIWAQVTTFPGAARIDPSTFVLCGQVYFVTGWLASQTATTKEVWKYSPTTNAWLQLSNFPGTASLDQAYFSIGNKGYVATGYDYSFAPSKELWEFTSSLGTSISVGSGTTTLCAGQTTTLTASGGLNYSWSTGATTSTIIIAPVFAATYSVTVSNGACSADTSITINISSNSLYLDMSPSRNICLGQSTTLSCGTSATSYTWSPANGLSNPYAATPVATPTVTTSYTVMAANAAGCTATDSIKVYVFPVPPTPTITASGNVLASSASTGNQWYLNGSIITGATGQFYTAIQSGFYQVIVTDANGCTATSGLLNFTYTGISENIPGFSFSIYPNPNDGNFSLDISAAKSEEISIFIMNETGQVVYMENGIKLNGQLSKRFHLKNIANGIYSIRIQTPTGREVRKFFVQ